MKQIQNKLYNKKMDRQFRREMHSRRCLVFTVSICVINDITQIIYLVYNDNKHAK